MNVKQIGAFLTVVILVLAAASGVNAKQGGESEKSPAADKDKSEETATHTVVVYYFYAPPRCNSCRNIQTYTEEALEKGFPAELKNKRLIWMPVDVSKKDNKHYIKDFELSSKSVVLADYKGEKIDKKKIVKWKNLEDIWKLLRDKPEFIKYIQGQTRAYLYEEDDEEKEDGK